MGSNKKTQICGVQQLILDSTFAAFCKVCPYELAGISHVRTSFSLLSSFTYSYMVCIFNGGACITPIYVLLSCWRRTLCQSHARCTTDTDIMRILYCALSSRPSPYIRTECNRTQMVCCWLVSCKYTSLRVNHICSSYSIHLELRTKNRAYSSMDPEELGNRFVHNFMMSFKC